MKKIQMMFAVVLVAFMAMAVQSCGSDKDDSTHNLSLRTPTLVATNLLLTQQNLLLRN